MPKNGQKSLFAKYIANRHDIDPNGALDIIAHGSWREIEVNTSSGIRRINARQAAKIIKKQKEFKKAKTIRLLSCSTGSHPEGFAQHLANALGKPVIAPNMTIHSYPDGRHWISDNGKKGEFKTFYPGGVKHGRK
ncbi:MAG: hypothetical protein MJ248_02770 [Bacilli bacterium]|nr:hypothetical protein [Bacilli bacterium]